MKRFFKAIGFLFLLTSCHTSPLHVTEDISPRRVPSAVSVALPSATQLFLKGKFLGKKTRFWYEDHYNEDLDLSVRRPAVNMSGTVFAEKYDKTGMTLFANFYHHGRFWFARVPQVGVKNVYLQLSYFPPKIGNMFIAAHSLLRFEMLEAHPVELVALMPDEATLNQLAKMDVSHQLQTLPAAHEGASYNLHNVVLSAESQWSQTDPKKAYDLIRGQHGAFMQIVRFASTEARLEEFYESGWPTSQITLENKQNLDRILAKGLQISQTDGISKEYNTFKYNCTTEAFRILQEAGGDQDQRLGFIRRYMETRVPTLAPMKAAQYGGIEVVPMALDPSLGEESFEAYTRVDLNKNRDICHPGTVPQNCPDLKNAKEVLRKASFQVDP